MAEFFAELKRRHIYRVAATYLVVAWLAVQVVNNLAPALRLPEWANSLVVVLLFIGFPVTLIFAWVQQMPKEGSAPARNAVLDWTLLGALAVVLLFMGYQQIVRSFDGTEKASREAAPGAAVSLAVLPFSNLSGDASQEFFSDGMTEEITSALARVPNMRVVGRTSAFQFKGENKDLRTIGQALSATHLIEGSVRREGNQLRITAQLIKVDDGTHIWAENYDRQLTGVFAVQEEIAQAIAVSLRVPLGLAQGETLVRSRTNDPASYDDYLRAKALVRARSLRTLTEAAGLLEQVVARDPDYAPAWSVLALAYALTPAYSPAWARGDVEETRQIVDATLPRAEVAARRAVELDPESAEGYMSLGAVRAYRARLRDAEEPFLKALELDPDNPDALHFYGQSLGGVGRLKDEIALRQRLRILEPFVPIFNWNFGYALWINGQTDDAQAVLKDVPPEFAFRQQLLASIYVNLGRRGEAADTILTLPRGVFAQGIAEELVRLLRTGTNGTAGGFAASGFTEALLPAHRSAGARAGILRGQSRCRIFLARRGCRDLAALLFAGTQVGALQGVGAQGGSCRLLARKESLAGMVPAGGRRRFRVRVAPRIYTTIRGLP